MTEIIHDVIEQMHDYIILRLPEKVTTWAIDRLISDAEAEFDADLSGGGYGELLGRLRTTLGDRFPSPSNDGYDDDYWDDEPGDDDEEGLQDEW